jgi:hypothetical protein
MCEQPNNSAANRIGDAMRREPQTTGAIPSTPAQESNPYCTPVWWRTVPRPDKAERKDSTMLLPVGTRRRGAAAVELAVLLPLLMFLFVIAIDYGRIFYYALTLENCARNGAVFGSNVANSQMPYSSIQQAAIADGANLNPPLTTANVAVANGSDANNNPTVTVTVSYTFQTLTGYPGLPNTVNLSRSVEMRVAPQ